MPWTMQDPPRPAKNWPENEKRACVRAANSALEAGKSDKEAIRACLGAGARVKGKAQSSSMPPGGDPMDNSRIVDLFMADKVLAGEPVRLLPFLEDGYWRWGAQQPPITADDATALLANFERRATTGLHQTNIPLNIEHSSLNGKIGTIKDLTIGDDGLYATFDLTGKGRDLLNEDAFDYLSPEIVWDLEDTRTGEFVGPFIVGAAVTNYPFFGDSTAMFSKDAGEHLSAEPPGDAGEGRVSHNQIFAIVRTVLDQVGLSPQQKKTEVETMADQQDAGTGAPPEAQIPEEFANRFAEMESQIEQFNQRLAERDSQIADQQEVITGQREQIAGLQDARLRERFSRQVQDLDRVGADNGQLVDELMWLHQADGSDEKGHFSYWTNLLSTVNQAMADSAAFQEAGQPGHRTVGSAYSKFSALVQEAASEQGLVVTEGDSNWARLAIEVAEANPALYSEYTQQQMAGRAAR